MKRDSGFVFFFPAYLKYMEAGLANTVIPEIFAGSNKDLQRKITEAHVFICSPEQLGQDSPERIGKVYDPKDVSLEKISLPFESCYIELTEDKSIKAQSTDGEVREFNCFHFIELSPLDIVCFSICRSNDLPFGIEMAHIDFRQDTTIGTDAFLKAILQTFCESLRNNGMGTERHHRQYPVKIGHHKYSVSVPHIIRIKPKKPESAMPVVARSIEWSNAFWVRGHWRQKTGGIGKDRHGDYKVQGFTWVSEHLRGDQESEIVKNIYRV